jgi:hypothetical protein
MASDPRISTPTAILLGSVIVAAGLFFGLRDRSDPQPPAPAPAPSAAALAPPSPAMPAEAVQPVQPAQPAGPAADRSAVAKQAEAALAQHRKSLTDQCLAPSLARKPDPPVVKYVFNVTFDAEGKQIARGVSEDREAARPEVTACVSEKLPTLTVPPPGQTVRVEIPLSLP